MGQITVFSGPERRRRWSEEERLRILTEAFSPGASVTDVARRHDVSTGLIYTWRRKLREANAEPMPKALPEPGFAEAMMAEDEGTARMRGASSSSWPMSWARPAGRAGEREPP